MSAKATTNSFENPEFECVCGVVLRTCEYFSVPWPDFIDSRRHSSVLSFFHLLDFYAVSNSEVKEQLPLLSSGSRASVPLKKEADGIRKKIEELGEDAADVRNILLRLRYTVCLAWL